MKNYIYLMRINADKERKKERGRFILCNRLAIEILNIVQDLQQYEENQRRYGETRRI
jgi:hypothetical protein